MRKGTSQLFCDTNTAGESLEHPFEEKKKNLLLDNTFL